MKRIAILLTLLATLSLVSCTSPDEDVAEIYDQMTLVVKRHTELAKKQEFTQAALRAELDPLEKKLLAIDTTGSEEARFGMRGKAADRYRDAITELAKYAHSGAVK